MKIINVVGGSKRGLGGHQFSVRDLCLASEGYYQAKVIQLGPLPNPCFEVLDSRFSFARIMFHNPISLIKAVCLLRQFALSGDVCFVAFDYLSLAMVRFASRGLNQPYILCKPGGSSWPVRTSAVPAFLLFSVENLDYFKKHQPAVAERSFLIQGRVNPVTPASPVEIEALRTLAFERKIFCVARFSVEKKVIFERGIHFFETYFAADESSCLCLLGIPSHQDVLELIQARVTNSPLKDRIVFLTEPQYYQNASRFFSLAHVLIGNGRTVMESLSLGVPSLVATTGRAMPILLTEQSQAALSLANLSSRSVVDDAVFAAAETKLVEMIESESSYQAMVVDSRALFTRVFSIEESQKTILTCAESAKRHATKVKLELNDWRMLLVGTLTVSYPNFVTLAGKLKARLKFPNERK